MPVAHRGLQEGPLADEADGARHADQADATEHEREGDQGHPLAHAGDPIEAVASHRRHHRCDDDEESALGDAVSAHVQETRLHAGLRAERKAEREVADLPNGREREQSLEARLVDGGDGADEHRRQRQGGE